MLNNLQDNEYLQASESIKNQLLPYYLQRNNLEPPYLTKILTNPLFEQSESLISSYQTIISSHSQYLRFSSHPSDHSIDKLEPKWNEEKLDIYLIEASGKVKWKLNWCKIVEIERDIENDQREIHFYLAIGDLCGRICFLEGKYHNDRIELNQRALSYPDTQCLTSCFVSLKQEGKRYSKKMLIVGSDKGNLHKYDPRDGRCIASFKLSSNTQVMAIQPIYDDKFLLVNCLDGIKLLTSEELEYIFDASDITGFQYAYALPVTENQTKKGLSALMGQAPLVFMNGDSGHICLASINFEELPSTALLNNFEINRIITYFGSLKDEISNIEFSCAIELDQSYQNSTSFGWIILLANKRNFMLLRTDGINSLQQVIPPMSLPIQQQECDHYISKMLFLDQQHFAIFNQANQIFIFEWNEREINVINAKDIMSDNIFLDSVFDNLTLKESSKANVLFKTNCCDDTLRVDMLTLDVSLKQARSPVSVEYCIDFSKNELDLPTFMTPVTLGNNEKTKDWIAKGYQSGLICLMPLYRLFDDITDDKDIKKEKENNNDRDDEKITHNKCKGYDSDNAIKHLSGHQYPITFLFEPAPSRLNTKLFLISADSIGIIKLWELSTGVCLATFHNHAAAVVRMTQIPLPNKSKEDRPLQTNTKKEFKTSNESNTLRIQQLVFTIGNDNSISILDLKHMRTIAIIPGNIHRITHLIYIDKPTIKFQFCYNNNHTSSFILSNNQLVKLDGNQEDPPFYKMEGGWVSGISFLKTTQTFTQIPATISVYPKYNAFLSYPIFHTYKINLRQLITDYQTRVLPSIRFASNSEVIYPKDKETKRQPAYSSASILRGNKDGLSHEETYNSKVTKALLRAVYGILTNSSYKQDFMGLFEKNLSNHHLQLAFKGEDDSLSLSAENPRSRKVYSFSPHDTSFKLLVILGLAKLALTKEQKIIPVITHFGSLLKEHIGSNFEAPSLTFLTHYWCDLNEDIQHAAKTIFTTCLAQLEESEKQLWLEYYLSDLPEVLPIDLMAQNKLEAVLVLGCIISSSHDITIEPHTRQLISQSLEWIISNHSQLKYRCMAMELISCSFRLMETYVDSIYVIKQIYSIYLHPNKLIRDRALLAILKIITTNPPLLISSFSLSVDMIDLKAILKLIPQLIIKRKSLMFSYISATVEVILKALDPKDELKRQALQPLATESLHELVSSYGMVDFHPATQRLAVGLMEGCAIIYDVRTCTRYLVLEGYTTPITSLCFSPDGKLLATFSLVEQVLKIWHTSAGLLGLITKSFRSVTPNPSHYNAHNNPDNIRSPPSLANLFNQNSMDSISSISAPASGRSSPYSTLPSSSKSKLNNPLNSIHSPPSTYHTHTSSLSFLSNSPSPYRTFNVKMDESDNIPVSPTTIMQSAELNFIGPRSIKLIVNGLELSFNI